MSDVSQGEGWWIASDGKWYPPESNPSQEGNSTGPPAPSFGPTQSNAAPKAQKPWWQRRWVIVLGVIFVLFVLAGIFGSATEEDTPGNSDPTPQEISPDEEEADDDLLLSEAFCNDLEAGFTPFQIWGGIRDDREPAEMADLTYGFAAISCPAELKTNEALRIYLENWDINPDV